MVTAPTMDLNERRRRALQEVDDASFSWFHVKVCLVAGVGFFTDAYDLFAINIACEMLKKVPNYYGAGGLTSSQELGLKIASPIGTFVGQLVFGWLADLLGRKRMYGVELSIIIVATLAQALSGHGPGMSIIGSLIFWRVIMGVGIGGDYPLSAVIASEFAATRTRGRLMNAVFAAQGFGNFTAALVAYIVVSAYKPQITSLDGNTSAAAVDSCWRWLIGFGCVPGLIALWFRLTIPETPRFTMDIARNLSQASQDVDTFLREGTYRVDPDAVVQRVRAPEATRKDFVSYFKQWRNFKVLFGAAYSWFALDIAFYGLGLNNSTVLQAIGFGDPATTDHTANFVHFKNISVGNLILSVAGLIPGYWVCFLFIDRWGRKPIQLMGFAVLTVLFCIMGFAYDPLKEKSVAAFVALFCFANFFQNFGPNTTTFIVPGEAFPTRYRSTGHGISAASGKLGAIIAQVAFEYLKNIGGPNNYIGHILQIFAFFMLTGVFSTLLIPETKGRTLEELSNEDQDGFASGYASAHAHARPGSVQPGTYMLGALANSSGDLGSRPTYRVVQRSNGQPSPGAQQRTSGVQQAFDPYAMEV